MKTKLVKRYWCDHCNKAGLQAGGMRRHEQHCTMNPARSCRVCSLKQVCGDDGGAPLADLMNLLPDYMDAEWDHLTGRETNRYQAFLDNLEIAMHCLRGASDGCPACIMAALRQKGIPVPMVDGFDFKKEMQVIFDRANEFREEQGGY